MVLSRQCNWMDTVFLAVYLRQKKDIYLTGKDTSGEGRGDIALLNLPNANPTPTYSHI